MFRVSCTIAALIIGSGPVAYGWAAAAGGVVSASDGSLVAQVTKACSPSVKGGTLDAACAGAICGAAGGAAAASQGEVTKLGGLAASYISRFGANAPAQADAIQACIAAGPRLLVIAFQSGTGGAVGAIGTPTQASPE